MPRERKSNKEEKENLLKYLEKEFNKVENMKTSLKKLKNIQLSEEKKRRAQKGELPKNADKRSLIEYIKLRFKIRFVGREWRTKLRTWTVDDFKKFIQEEELKKEEQKQGSKNILKNGEYTFFCDVKIFFGEPIEDWRTHRNYGLYYKSDGTEKKEVAKELLEEWMKLEFPDMLYDSVPILDYKIQHPRFDKYRGDVDLLNVKNKQSKFDYPELAKLDGKEGECVLNLIMRAVTPVRPNYFRKD